MNDEIDEGPPALWLDNIARRYGTGETAIEVLNGADLTLWPGQSVALIAPSGAGKSTLLHLAGLLETPDEGEVHISGAPTSKMTDDQRTALRRGQIGFVYQFHHLLPEFSALENVVIPQMIAGLSRAEAAARARELLGFLGLGARESHRPRARQRAAPAARGRTDWQSRPEDRRPRVRDAGLVGQGEQRRRADRDAQHGSGGANGSAGDAQGRAGRRDVSGAAVSGLAPGI